MYKSGEEVLGKYLVMKLHHQNKNHYINGGELLNL